MIKIFFIFIQLAILVIIGSLVINYSFPVSIAFDEIILSTSTSFIIFLVILIIFFVIFVQRIVYFLKYRIYKFNLTRQKNYYEKGYYAFTKGMIALANKDYKKAIQENKKVSYYIQDKSLNLLLKSETLKIEKNYVELEKVYEEMIKNEDTKIFLGHQKHWRLVNQSLVKYDLLFDIGYNARPVIKGKGSAIFLHLSDKKYKPTNGCVAILKKDFLKILPLIQKNTKILIS